MTTQITSELHRILEHWVMVRLSAELPNKMIYERVHLL